MSHEETLTVDERCVRIGVLCRAIDAIESRTHYKEKQKDITEMTEILCNEAFDLGLSELTMAKISTYLKDYGGAAWSEYRFNRDRSGWNVTLVKRRK